MCYSFLQIIIHNSYIINKGRKESATIGRKLIAWVFSSKCGTFRNFSRSPTQRWALQVLLPRAVATSWGEASPDPMTLETEMGTGALARAPNQILLMGWQSEWHFSSITHWTAVYVHKHSHLSTKVPGFLPMHRKLWNPWHILNSETWR